VQNNIKILEQAPKTDNVIDCLASYIASFAQNRNDYRAKLLC